MHLIKRLWSEEKGEDVAEYAMTLGLIAIVAVATIAIVGTVVGGWWEGISAEISTYAIPA